MFCCSSYFWDMFGPPRVLINNVCQSSLSASKHSFQGSARIQIKVEEAGKCRFPWWVTGILMLLVTGRSHIILQVLRLRWVVSKILIFFTPNPGEIIYYFWLFLTHVFQMGSDHQLGNDSVDVDLRQKTRNMIDMCQRLFQSKYTRSTNECNWNCSCSFV